MKQEKNVMDKPQYPHILQQRRIKHLTSLCFRNLTISLPSHYDAGIGQDETPLVYFSLLPQHKDINTNVENEFFVSEKVSYSPNPTWLSFKIPDGSHLSLTDFIVRLWIGNEGTYLPALQWKISLGQLSCIGQTVYNSKVVFHSNAVVLGLYGLYHAPHSSVTVAPDLTLLPSFDPSDIKNSYNVFTLRRISLGKCATVRSKRDVTLLHNLIKQKISQRKTTTQLEIELENIQHKIMHLRQLLQREQTLLAHERKLADKKKLAIEEKEADLLAQQNQLNEDYASYHEKYSSSLLSKEKAGLLRNQLGLRRRKILSELSHIFPTSSVKDTSSKYHKSAFEEILTICDVKLPESENFNSKEDASTSVALGYTSQLLSLMSHFLLVPLRYPFIHMGSHSSIVDHVTEKLSDRERIFPIYVKGKKDRFLFEYGVFLLNKNVAQLRYYCGLGTRDLRPTLSNIKTLLEERLGATAVLGHSSQPISIVDPRSITFHSVDSTSSLTSIAKIADDFTNPPSYKAYSAIDISNQVNKTNQIESNPQAFKLYQRENRNTELSQMRNQLFGANEVRKPKERPPTEYEEDRGSLRVGLGPLPNSSFYISSMVHDSAESVTLLQTIPQNKRLTGLEEVKKPHQKEVKDLASARAELFGRKAPQFSKESSRWSRRTGNYNTFDKGNEVFAQKSSVTKQDFDRSKIGEISYGNSRQNNSVDPRSNQAEYDGYVLCSSAGQSEVSNDKDKPFSEFEKERELPYISPAHHSQLSGTNGWHRKDEETTSDKNVFILDPDNCATLPDLGEEELDLC